MKKYRQNTLQHIKKRSFRRRIICKQSYYPVLQQFLSSIDQHLTTSRQQFFKSASNDTTTVGIVTIGALKLVVKRYNFRNFYHGLKVRCRPSKAMRSWRFAQQLLTHGIQTANPIAVVEERLGPLWGRAYYITEYVPGIRGCEFFADSSAYQSDWPQTIAAIEELTLQLRHHGFTHADYHFGNLIIHNTQPVLIDLDNMQQIKNTTRTFQRLHQKDINNFRRYLDRNLLACQAFKQFQRHQLF